MPAHRLTELDSGVRVVSERMGGVRSVALGFWVGTGSRDEHPEQVGISHFLEHLLFKGNDRYSAVEIAALFDSIGAESNAFTSKESTVVHARCLDRHLETSFELMSEMALRPAYCDLETEREVILEEIAMYEDEPQDKVHDLFAKAVFGEHTLGRPVIGTTEIVSGLDRQQVSRYHDTRYLPGNIVIAAAGSVDHDRLVELATAELGAGEAGEFERRAPDAPVARSPKALFHRKDTDQYHICLGGLGIARGDDRRFALAALDTIFGGSMSSRLFQEVREKRGLAYSIFSFTGQYQDGGSLGVYVGTRGDNVAEALEIIATELTKLQEQPATEDELARAKEHFKGRLVLSMESSGTRMNRLGGSTLGEVEILSLDEIIARVDAITIDSLRELAEAFYLPGGMSAAGVGPDEDRFREALGPIGDALGDDLVSVA